jgi:hypothetical protein
MGFGNNSISYTSYYDLELFAVGPALNTVGVLSKLRKPE